MPSFDIPGNTNDWINTGVQVRQGQWLRITASGFISFAFAGTWPRNPDGVDQNGQGRETAPDGHPGPRMIKNSLLVRIGGQVLQAGTDTTLRAPASGPVQLLANDDFRADNGGSWRVQLDAGVLHQRLLIVSQGKAAADQATVIKAGIDRFGELVAHHTDGQVAISSEGGHLDLEVDPSELVPPRSPGEDGSDQLVAGYSSTFSTLLGRRGLRAQDFDGVFRLYGQPAGYDKWGYWTWSFITGLPRRIGYTCIPVNALAREPDRLEGLLLHEYLHHVDFRFADVGVPEFYDPDTKPKTPPMTNHQFYELIMRRETNGTPPPYGRLHGVFGRLG